MPDNKKITIYDVARNAGVSRQTVSRVINNRPDVAYETRERVQQAIKLMNYQPSAIAQSLSRQTSYHFRSCHCWTKIYRSFCYVKWYYRASRNHGLQFITKSPFKLLGK
jgi:transcriptional regulator with XRE-family HTH domain